MLEEEIIDCCKRLKLSLNLAEMAQKAVGESIRNTYISSCLRSLKTVSTAV